MQTFIRAVWQVGREISPNTELLYLFGLPWWLSSKESPCNAGDMDWTPELGRSPGEGYGNPLQYSCLKNPMDRGAWQTAVHEVAKSQT